MEEKSEFEELPDRLLIKICKQILQEYNTEELPSYDDYFYTTSCKLFENVWGFDCNALNVDYIYQILKKNIDNINESKNFSLIRPELTSLEWDVDEQENVYRVNYYNGVMNCYSENKEDKREFFEIMRNQEQFEWWDNRVNYEDVDSEVTDINISVK